MNSGNSGNVEVRSARKRESERGGQNNDEKRMVKKEYE